MYSGLASETAFLRAGVQLGAARMVLWYDVGRGLVPHQSLPLEGKVAFAKQMTDEVASNGKLP